MARKMYTAFISSPSSLKKERKNILDVLLNFDVFLVSMEHFVVQTQNGFHDIEQLIDDSDFFILLLGKRYGSREETPAGDGLSWTEKEYLYVSAKANVNNTKIIVFQLEDLTKILKVYRDDMTDEELAALDQSQPPDDLRAQITFARRLSGQMVKIVPDTFSMKEALASYIDNVKKNNTASGWIRGIAGSGVHNLEFNRTYYQVHLSSHDENYIRIGTAKFSADENTYSRQIHIEGTNFKPTYDKEKQQLVCAIRNKTEWSGDYHYDDGKLVGIYEAKKRVKDQFGGRMMESGMRSGIHKLTIAEGNAGYVIDGTFQDAVGHDNMDIACKSGDIFFFETEEDRLHFLEKECPDILEYLQEEG